MMLLNLRNSGDDLNWSSVSGGGCVSLSFVSTCLELIGNLPVLTGQLLVGKPPSNDVTHDENETLNVSHVPVIVSEHLFFNIAEQMKWLTET
jgi:hypothetical protein